MSARSALISIAAVCIALRDDIALGLMAAMG